jgi:hypothetical protein
MHSIRLAARNEGLEYQDDLGVYRFNVHLRKGEWTVLLPCSKGDSPADHELSPEERERILPRIETFLSRIKWLGFFPRSYTVRFVREETGEAGGASGR